VGASGVTWVKLEDDFSENPKIARLSDSGLALWVTGLAYCNRNLTDGFIPNQVGLGQLRYCEGNAVPSIRELETVGLWDAVPGGWEVHDFHDYQPTREAVLAERLAARERMKEVRQKRKGSSVDVRPNVQKNFERSSTTPVPVPVPETAEKTSSSAMGSKTTGDLPVEKELLTTRLLAAVSSDADERTPANIRALAAKLPPSSLAKVLESLSTKQPRNRAAYVVGSLKSELVESGRTA
jgi:hypothetical protein